MAPQYTPPYPIADDKLSDSSVRLVDLNGDGRVDLTYHRWLHGNHAEKGAYLNDGVTWVWSPEFTPPFHITSGCIVDLGARFVDLNADGRVDFVYHRWINNKVFHSTVTIRCNYARYFCIKTPPPTTPLCCNHTRILCVL